MGDGPIELARSRGVDNDMMLGFDELGFPLTYMTRKTERKNSRTDLLDGRAGDASASIFGMSNDAFLLRAQFSNKQI
jgi:hypothetical protein